MLNGITAEYTLHPRTFGQFAHGQQRNIVLSQRGFQTIFVTMARPRYTPEQWAQLPDDELLQIRVCDLGLSVPGTALAERVERLYAELADRAVAFRPPCYLADEWLCPDKMPAIGIPFYLAHPRLTALERRMMLEAEGDTQEWCMRLLRHEAGHALNYAYRLYRRTRWRELFGRFSAPYSDAYYSRPYSRRFVQHLDDNYAQAHPDEDWAETFAVWLDPSGDWRARYKGWPALRKLEYVNQTMARAGGLAPLVTTYTAHWSADSMKATLKTYYDRKRRALGLGFPGYYDPALTRLFPPAPTGPSAAQFLQRHRRHLTRNVARWSHQRVYDVDKLVRRLAARCSSLGCRVQMSQMEAAIAVSALISSIMSSMRHMQRGVGSR